MLPSTCHPTTGARPQPACELGDIFRLYGPAYRAAHRLPLSQLKVMRAIETCRPAALGGHKESCAQCGYERYAYNSCRNRHCPKCQALAKAQWLEQREAELLPVWPQQPGRHSRYHTGTAYLGPATADSFPRPWPD